VRRFTIASSPSEANTVEQGINFSGEVSLVGARGHDGSTVFYPLTHNLHQISNPSGVTKHSIAITPT
jgi:5-(carboxyamino)imidazole ribonucleotide synthase